MNSQFANIATPSEIVVSNTFSLEFGGRLEGLSEQPRQDGSPAPFSPPEPVAQIPLRPNTVSGSATGVLPIQINIPTGGQVYRFAKTIIQPNDELSMEVQYSASWLPKLLRLIALLLLAGGIYWRRRAILKRLRRMGNRFAGQSRLVWQNAPALWHTMQQAARSFMTTVVLLGLLGPAWFAGPPFAGMVLFGLWISVIYQVVRYTRHRAETKSMRPATVSVATDVK